MYCRLVKSSSVIRVVCAKKSRSKSQWIRRFCMQLVPPAPTGSRKYIGTSFHRNLMSRSSIENRYDDPKEAFKNLASILKEGNRIYARYIVNILDTWDSENVDIADCILLLQCCGNAIPDRKLEERAELTEFVWKQLTDSEIILTTALYNAYLQTCLENKIKISATQFIESMKCNPDKETYRILLEIVCSNGNIPESTYLLNEMKIKGIPADETIFNCIVLVQTSQKGLEYGKSAIQNMHLANVRVTNRTYSALLEGTVLRNNYEEFLQAIDLLTEVLDGNDFLKLLEVLAELNYLWFNDVERVSKVPELSKELEKQVEYLCIQLIFRNKPEAAFYFFRKLIKSTEDDRDYAYSLLHQLVRADIPLNTVLGIVNELKENNLNTFALERVAEAALRNGKTDLALELFKQFKVLRPHYFWPHLIKAGVDNGEIGVLSAVKEMINLGVRPDADTLQYYVIPMSEKNQYEKTISQLRKLGLTVREILTPLLGYLFKKGELSIANQLCDNHKVTLDSDRLLKLLARAFVNTRDVDNVTALLQLLAKSPSACTDYIGQCLIKIMCGPKEVFNFDDLSRLLQKMKSKQMKIASITAEYLTQQVKIRLGNDHFAFELQKAINLLADTSGEITHNLIPHPRDMNLIQLECHLKELKSKNMQTRGVLRRLIQEHCRLGNESRVNELRNEFMAAGYKESPGMKASLLHVCAQNRQTATAFKLYEELRTFHPEFKLDDFKILDLATCLLSNNDFEKALRIVKEGIVGKKVRNDIIRNCVEVLDACHDIRETQVMFQVLVNKSCCRPNNLTLSPLIRKAIPMCEPEEVISIYEDIVNKYKYAPLRDEFLKSIVKTENIQLIDKALKLVAKVYNDREAGIALVTCLSESGYKKILRRMINESHLSLSREELENLCQSWVDKSNMSALKTFADATEKLLGVNRRTILIHIMKLYCSNNDCDGAVSFYRFLGEREETIPKQVSDDLLAMIRRCKYEYSEEVKNSVR